MSRVTVRVPSTTANCGPGFDAIGIACSLYNEIEVSLLPGGEPAITIVGQGCSQIPCDSRNIAFQAARQVLERVGWHQQTIRMKLTNHIPLARGLGSSAAAIVGGLVAANEATGGTLSRQQLLDMATAMEGHPDNVAPALFGGICLSVMHPAGTQCLSFPPPADLQLVVAVPDFTLSTKVSRQVLPKAVSMRDAVFNISRTGLLVAALARGELSFLPFALEDRIHQPYRQKLIPGLPEVFAAARENGALGVTISGAGPALMAYTAGNAKAIGQAMVTAFRRQNKGAVYHVLSVNTEGAKIIRSE